MMRKQNRVLLIGMLISAVIAAVAIVAIGLTAYEHAEDTDEREMGFMIENIRDNPTEFVGDTVTLSGVVQDTYTGGLFVLSEKEDFAIDHKILVVPKAVEGAQKSPKHNDVVQVTGVVTMVRVPEVERALGRDLNDNELAEWTQKPALIVDSVRVVHREG